MNIFKLNYIFIILLIFFSSSCTKVGQFDSNPDGHATFTTKDGVILVGKYVPPSDPDKLTFIMLHGLASIKNEWYGFAEKIRQNGYGYFAFDLRGHGESKKGKDGRDVDLKYFSAPGPGSEWSRMVDDLSQAVKYLMEKKGIRKEKIGLAGASLGANIVLIYASQNKSIPVVILLSPGMEYAGLKIEDSAKKFANRYIAISASPLDSYAFESSAYIYQIVRKNNCKATFFTGQANQHGVQIFSNNFENQFIDWLNNLH